MIPMSVTSNLFLKEMDKSIKTVQTKKLEVKIRKISLIIKVQKM